MRKADLEGMRRRRPWLGAVIVPIVLLTLLSFGAFISRDRVHDDFWPGPGVIWLLTAVILLVGWQVLRPRIREGDEEEPLDLAQPLVPFILLTCLLVDGAMGIFAVHLALNVTGFPSNIQGALLYSSLTLSLALFGIVAIHGVRLKETRLGRFVWFLGCAVGACSSAGAVGLSAVLILFGLFPFGVTIFAAVA